MQIIPKRIWYTQNHTHGIDAAIAIISLDSFNHVTLQQQEFSYFILNLRVTV